jgi:hypothetical protein
MAGISLFGRRMHVGITLKLIEVVRRIVSEIEESCRCLYRRFKF